MKLLSLMFDHVTDCIFKNGISKLVIKEDITKAVCIGCQMSQNCFVLAIITPSDILYSTSDIISDVGYTISDIFNWGGLGGGGAPPSLGLGIVRVIIHVV